jgi:hypothetical protein
MYIMYFSPMSTKWNGKSIIIENEKGNEGN